MEGSPEHRKSSALTEGVEKLEVRPPQARVL